MDGLLNLLPPGTLDLAKDWLARKAKSWSDEGGVCRGTCMTLEGVEALGAAHSACHSWIGTAYTKSCHDNGGYQWGRDYAKNAKNFLTLNCHSAERAARVCSKAASDALVLWMARESPFSQFVLNKDDEKNLTEGGVVLLCGPDGLSQAEAMWVCKVLRFITEGAKAAETFLELIKGKVDPMLAVFVASHVRSVKGATFGYTGIEGHSTVFSNYNAAGSILGLLARNIDKKAASTSSVFTPPAKIKRGDDVTFANAGAEVATFCRPIEKDDGWGGKVKGVGAEGKDLVARCLKWQAGLTARLPGGAIPDYVPPAFVAAAPPPVKMPDSNTVYLELDL